MLFKITEEALMLLRNLKVVNQRLEDKDSGTATVAEQTLDNKLILHPGNFLERTNNSNKPQIASLLTTVCVTLSLFKYFNYNSV